MSKADAQEPLLYLLSLQTIDYNKFVIIAFFSQFSIACLYNISNKKPELRLQEILREMYD